MRAFRIRQRHPNGKIVKHRDYIGLEKLLTHGIETYNRYNDYVHWSYTTRNLPAEERRGFAEVCEKIDGKWVKLDEKNVEALFSENTIVNEEWLISKGFELSSGHLLKTFAKDISNYEKEHKTISVCTNPGNVYVYLREGLKNDPREDDDLIVIFNGDIQGPLKKEYIETLYNLLTNSIL